MADIGQHKRSKKGCVVCRAAKVKCSETHPSCHRCTRLSLGCEWPQSRPSLKQIRKGYGPLKRREIITYRQLAPVQPEHHPPAKHSKPLPLEQDENFLIGIKQTGCPRNGDDKRTHETKNFNHFVEQLPSLPAKNGGHHTSVNYKLQQAERQGEKDSNKVHTIKNHSPKKQPQKLDIACTKWQRYSPDMFSHQRLIPFSLPSYYWEMPSSASGAFGEIDNQAIEYYCTVLAWSAGTKDARWSTFNVMLAYAFRNPGIMHLILAASLSQMSRTVDVEELWNPGKFHYQSGSKALAIFMNKMPLGCRIEGTTSIDHCKILSAMWLVQFTFRTIWGSKGASSMQRLSQALAEYTTRNHLLDIYAQHCASTKALSVLKKPSTLSKRERSLTGRMIVWLFYEDCEAEFCYAGGYFSNLLCENENELILRHIYHESQTCLELYFESEYPLAESIDDVIRSAALELRFISTIEYNKVNRAAAKDKPAGRFLDILTGMDETAKRYTTVFELARDNTGCDTQLVGTSKKMVLQWNAVYVYCLTYCLVENDSIIFRELRKRTIEAMLAILKYITSVPVPALTHWFEWPLFLVGVYAEERSEQQWALKELSKTKYFPVLKEILEIQETTKSEVSIDQIRSMSSK